jgi:hypothetical protein
MELNDNTEIYYHVQGGADAEPITNVQTRLTETPDNLEQFAENTQTPGNSEDLTTDNIFNYYPTGGAGTQDLEIRNPLLFCKRKGPCD